MADHQAKGCHISGITGSFCLVRNIEECNHIGHVEVKRYCCPVMGMHSHTSTGLYCTSWKNLLTVVGHFNSSFNLFNALPLPAEINQTPPGLDLECSSTRDMTALPSKCLRKTVDHAVNPTMSSVCMLKQKQ